MGIFIGDTAPSKIFVGGSEVASVRAGDTKIRPIGPDKDYLCFTANTSGSTIKLTKKGSAAWSVSLEVSTDGIARSPYTIGATITLTNAGDKVYRRSTSETDSNLSGGANAYHQFEMTGSIAASGDITSLINKNLTLSVGISGLRNLFSFCTSLTTAPSLPATTLASTCYTNMFYGCTNLTSLPSLPATTLASSCYAYMFQNCSKIKFSSTKTGGYQTPYRIPTTGTGTTASNWNGRMFYQTGGTFTSDPSLNTTYYTSNTVV